MDPPSLSELTQMALALRGKINALELTPSTTTPTTSGGKILSAGTVLYCRPSRAQKLIRRLGTANVAIADTSATAGFARGHDREAKKWTNRVYPTDIGPSCSGITSDSVSARATVTNNAITAETWNPLAMFSGTGGLKDQFAWYLNNFSVIRTLWFFKGNLTIWKMLTMPQFFNNYGRLRNTYTDGNPWIEMRDIQTNTMTICAAMYADQYSADGMIVVDCSGNHPLLMSEAYEAFEFDGMNFPVLTRNSLYLIYDEILGTKTNLYNDWVMSSDVVMPYKVSVYQISSDRLLNGGQTPLLRYGGYDRKNPPGTGPEVTWGRTSLVQIKILRDVRVDSS